MFSFGFGLFCIIYCFVSKRSVIPDLLVAPVIWTSIEFLRSIGIYGSPMGILGYSQYQNLPLIQIADITGVLGISFLAVFVNSAIYNVIFNYSKEKVFRIGLIVSFVLVLTMAYGFVKLSVKTVENGPKVALIQCDQIFSSRLAYSSEKVMNVLDDLTRKASVHKPDIIIWPETILREDLRMDFNNCSEIKRLVQTSRSYLLLGNPTDRIIDGKVRHFNSALLISPDGKVVDQYNKIHLVPFWEFLPLRNFVPYLANVDAKGVFDKGDEYTVFKTPFGRFSALICFEGIFDGHVRRFVNNGAEFLVNISNDAWSMSSAEHWQHASMDVFRAIENRVYYVRVGNTGITAIIDKTGRILKFLHPYERGYLVGRVGLSSGKTLYTRFGNWFGWLCSLSTAVMGIASLYKPRKGEPKA